MLKNLTSFQKKALLAATAVPVIYFIYFFIHVFSMVLSGPQAGPPSFLSFQILFVVHFIMILWMIGLLVVYVIHIINNKNLNEQERILWIVLLVVGHIIAMFAYWFLKLKGSDVAAQNSTNMQPPLGQ